MDRLKSTDSRTNQLKRSQQSSFQKGSAGEDIACEFLLRHGYEIVKRNLRYRYAEIDIIAIKGDTIFFIEVKSSNVSFPISDRVDRRKIAKITSLANSWLSKYPKIQSSQIALIHIDSNNKEKSEDVVSFTIIGV